MYMWFYIIYYREDVAIKTKSVKYSKDPGENFK